MMKPKQKLELTWIGKENRPKLEPRILLEDAEKSYHAPHRVSENDIFDNRLIFGDNLLALKALEQEFAGKVKCIFIDPPYNTGSAFSHYDDGVEHSLWLSLIRDRIELLRKLLAQDGVLWMTIDDTESHYLKIVCDEIFGRQNFVANVVWQKKFSPQANAIWLSDSHDHLLVYAKDKATWRPNLLSRTEESDARYSNPDNDPRGPWTSGDFTISLTGGQRGAQYARTGISANIYEIVTPSGRKLTPPKGRCWGTAPERFKELVADNRIWFGANGSNVPRLKRFLSEVQEGIVCMTVWLRSEVGDNQDAKREVATFNPDDIFATPKPERLLRRVLELASHPGDWILDSFAGSGTTGAVAHKMGRRWIMVELGEHCHTHIIPRLKKVIDGTDQGGISKAVNWEGGGGFRYYRLAPSLLEKDKWGNWVINKQYQAAMLAEAVCKLEGFIYAPSDTVYWQHGHSTERDFIYVTTQNLNHDQLQQLSDEVGPHRTLLVMCTAFRSKPERYSNLTLKKIPKTVLSRCEWGKDDYSLRVANLPQAPPKPGQQQLGLE
ncbi:site-specific DNA-methyltransferase [candidate division KSB1 bacterium]|nr:MAG: site-specific DNA-methyltransferase [candidate division KSB1 bacterium]MCE7940638.1 site-specific DNA-methyltransferase [Chlorobi bacterium CHB1]